MNDFIGVLVGKMRNAGIYTLLVKGQGIAQCYKRPLWRTCGDVDLLFNKSGYEKSKSFLAPLAQVVEIEDKYRLHLGMTISNWNVELHGSLNSRLSKRVNQTLDKVLNIVFFNGEVRSWNNNTVPVFMPSVNNDIIIVFTHFVRHFFIEGVGLRQICDWCRLIWANKDTLDDRVLKKNLKDAGLLTEWYVFTELAVDTLGMPAETMPLYCKRDCYKRKASRILKIILKTGNMGHNNDVSYKRQKSLFVSYVITFLED